MMAGFVAAKMMIIERQRQEKVMTERHRRERREQEQEVISESQEKMREQEYYRNAAHGGSAPEPVEVMLLRMMPTGNEDSVLEKMNVGRGCTWNGCLCFSFSCQTNQHKKAVCHHCGHGALYHTGAECARRPVEWGPSLGVCENTSERTALSGSSTQITTGEESQGSSAVTSSRLYPAAEEGAHCGHDELNLRGAPLVGEESAFVSFYPPEKFDPGRAAVFSMNERSPSSSSLQSQNGSLCSVHSDSRSAVALKIKTFTPTDTTEPEQAYSTLHSTPYAYRHVDINVATTKSQMLERKADVEHIAEDKLGRTRK